MAPIPHAWLEAVYGHYPRNLESTDPSYGEAGETRRLRDAQQRARGDRTTLVLLMDAIESDAAGVKAMDFSYPQYDAGYRLRFNADQVDANTRHWREVVALVSFIAPAYAVYQATTDVMPNGEQRVTTAAAPDPDVAPLWDVVVRRIEQTFGHARVDADLGSTIIPDVQVQNVPLGRVTLYDALFTPSRD